MFDEAAGICSMFCIKSLSIMILHTYIQVLWLNTDFEISNRTLAVVIGVGCFANILVN